MKAFTYIIVLTLLFIMPILAFSQEHEPSYYTNKIASITSDFDGSYMDENEVDDLRSKASNVVSDINDELENETLSYSLKLEYKKSLSAAEDLKNALGVISGSAYLCENIQSFYRGAAVLGCSVTPVFTDKYCLNFAKVVYRELVCYVVMSKSDATRRISCKWSANKGMDTGSLEAGFWSNSVRCLYDNRDNPAITSIYLTTVTCY